MISQTTGEISFKDGLQIQAHAMLRRLIESVSRYSVSSRRVPIEGWSHHCLGNHSTELGTFAVEVTTGSEDRVEGAFISHDHAFYDSTTKHDSERRAFHEGIVATDLRGQREFSWGNVFCRIDPRENRDWLVVIYSPFCGIPLKEKEVQRFLMAHEPAPTGK